MNSSEERLSSFDCKCQYLKKSSICKGGFLLRSICEGVALFGVCLSRVWTKRGVGHGVGHGLPYGLPYGLPVVNFC